MSFGRLSLVVLFLGCGCVFWSTEAWAKRPRASRSHAVPEISGREIFLREWLPNDPRSHGGDGLGPVFNDTSCVACHNQGGLGGGGAEGKNVQILSAFVTPPQERQVPAPQRDFGFVAELKQFAAGILQSAIKAEDSKERETRQKELKAELQKIHPGLVSSRSVVLHKSATDPEYMTWRQKVFGNGGFEIGEDATESGLAPIINQVFGGSEPETIITSVREAPVATLIAVLSLLGRASTDSAMPKEMQRLRFEMITMGSFDSPVNSLAGQNGNFQVTTSQRNTTALFGAGLIDSIPDKVLEELAEQQANSTPRVTGRAAKLKDGKIGRFGWKAQKANLYDFTMIACAVELGLHIPDHVQSGAPHRPEYQPTGYDLDKAECNALVQFLKDLPAPTRSVPDVPQLAEGVRAGEKMFTQVGCAACHVPKLGDVQGIYSDLLLHDMGQELGDTGGYGVFVPNSPSDNADEPILEITQLNSAGAVGLAASRVSDLITMVEVGEELNPPKFGAGRQEWRTPPLWGVRDSAPYLHDGRAKTLEQAIALHGGEGQQAASSFFRLNRDEQTRVLSFLRSLVAPDFAIAGTR